MEENTFELVEKPKTQWHYDASILDVEKMAEAIIFRITFTAASGTKHEFRFRGRVYRSKKKAIEAAMNWLMESEDEK